MDANKTVLFSDGDRDEPGPGRGARRGDGCMATWVVVGKRILAACVLAGLVVVWWKKSESWGWGWGRGYRVQVEDAHRGGNGGGSAKTLAWNEIRPSKDLAWHDCYELYDCARLDVPLDWLDLSDARVASIAIIRYRATSKTDYKGPIFINPGGPGGSGVWFIKHLAPYYQSVVGRNHDIISFDPRGTGATRPHISCWTKNSSASMTSAMLWSMSEPPVVDAHPGILYDAYAHAHAFSQQCASTLGDEARFVSTPSVARDMLHIMEKVGEKKLRYWGFSYGTYLGVVFASLFPDRIERMVNDGNVDAREYNSGAGIHFLADTDKVMASFYDFCHQAGPSLCAFHSSTPEAIATRLDSLLLHLRHHPVIVPASPRNARPEMVSYSHVRRMIASALYRPLVVFPVLAEALAALEKGNGRPFIDLTSQGDEETSLCGPSHETQDGDPETPTPELPEAEGSAEAELAILCTDGLPVTGDVEDFSRYVEILVGLSRAAGATMAGMRLGCVGWSPRAKWEFAGPFEGNTSFPILFVANVADNITPYRSAVQNAAGFPGSTILIQDSYGHTSLSTPSRCTARAIREYFQKGTIPAHDTVCVPDLVPFEPWNLTTAASVEEADLDRALYSLMQAKLPFKGMK